MDITVEVFKIAPEAIKLPKIDGWDGLIAVAESGMAQDTWEFSVRVDGNICGFADGCIEDIPHSFRPVVLLDIVQPSPANPTLKPVSRMWNKSGVEG